MSFETRLVREICFLKPFFCGASFLSGQRKLFFQSLWSVALVAAEQEIPQWSKMLRSLRGTD